MTEAVAVVIVARDRYSAFPRCLEAVYANTQEPFHVIVVAGGADAVTNENLRRLCAKRENTDVILVDHLLPPGEARNLALKHSTARFCVILENDTMVHQDWLRSMLDCMREEGAAVVTPLVWWYRGLHTAGCAFKKQEKDGRTVLTHEISYTDIRRKRIDYPENHCILIDRQLLPGAEIFDDVEPFDVDLGLMLQERGLSVFFEPSSIVTYSPSPPLELVDIPLFKFRWNRNSWEERNKRFARKWSVTYGPSTKLSSYRRQQLKLGLAYWYPTKVTVQVSNGIFEIANRLQRFLGRRHS